jgi:hypothetical protein
MKKARHLDSRSRFQAQYPNYKLETSIKEVQSAYNYRIVLSIIRNELGQELLRKSFPVGPYENLAKLKELVETMAIEEFLES